MCAWGPAHVLEVGDRPVLVAVEEHQEGITLRAELALPAEELIDQVRGIRDQVRYVDEDRVDGEHGVAADEGVAVGQVLLDGSHPRLDKLGLLHLGHEAEGAAPDVLVRVVQVVQDLVAHQDELRQQFALEVDLVDDLEVHERELLEDVVLLRQHEPNDGHQEAVEDLAVDQQHDRLLHRLDLLPGLALLQQHAQLVALVRHDLRVIDQQRALLFHSRHGPHLPTPGRPGFGKGPLSGPTLGLASSTTSSMPVLVMHDAHGMEKRDVHSIHLLIYGRHTIFGTSEASMLRGNESDVG